MKDTCKVVILGGGILGTHLAYWLSLIFEDDQICLVEKEGGVGRHMSSRNTGVIHRPFYLDPNKKGKMAKAANDSYVLWKAYAKARGLKWNNCGTIEVALNDAQIETLRKYQRWAIENGMKEEEMEFLDQKQLALMEPAVKAVAGLYCKTDTSVDFGSFTRSLFGDAAKNGVNFVFEFDLEKIVQKGESVLLISKDEREIEAQFMINCAGGNALKIAKMMGVAEEYEDINFRGEYWKVKSEHSALTKRNIYSVPRHGNFPFLDPHWVICADGNVIIGPNAVPVVGPYTYNGLSQSFGTVMKKIFSSPRQNKLRLMTNPEFLKLSWSEWRSSLSHSMMVNRLKKFMPGVGEDYLLEKGQAGVRASLIDSKGGFVPESLEIYGNNCLHILNYNSPGATGAPAYTQGIVRMLMDDGRLGCLSVRDNSRSGFTL